MTKKIPYQEFKLRTIFSGEQKGQKETEQGKIKGKMLLSRSPVSFLGDVNLDGVVVVDDSDVRGERIDGKIFAFPYGRGSTVGTYVILRLSKAGKAPMAIINKKTESIIAAGAVISRIPLFDSPEPDLFSYLKPGNYEVEIRVGEKESLLRILEFF